MDGREGGSLNHFIGWTLTCEDEIYKGFIRIGSVYMLG